MRLLIILILFFKSFAAIGQQDIIGKWKFECIVIDRDTIFLRSDSSMAFRTEEKKVLRDTLGRKLFNLQPKKIDTAKVLLTFIAHAAAFIRFMDNQKSQWYIPIHPSDSREKPGIVYYRIVGGALRIYEDVQRRKVAMSFNMSVINGLLQLESRTGVKTIYILSKTI